MSHLFLDVPGPRDANNRMPFAILFLLAVLTGCAGPISSAPINVEKLTTGNTSIVRITAEGQPFLTYNDKPTELPRPGIDPAFRRGGYIHPVVTPRGIAITDDYPTNHIHHHGIWFAWTNTRFENRKPDFWNMGSKKGTVEFVRNHRSSTDGSKASFKTEHRYVDLLAPEPKTALTEFWEVTGYPARPNTTYRMFDLTSTQHCATEEPLILPKYHYGGLGFRGHEQWNGVKSLRVLTSEGDTDRVKANETRARWCRLSGEVNKETVGIAILCHPKNFRAPQPIRVHPKEPFFCYAPSQLGDWSIEPGKPYISRYRFIVFDGELDATEIDRLWNEYAAETRAR